ncbi:16S rRNA (cytosine(1402)-N(4))-methyltransferase RsmH [Algicella marina]|uniref:16S rRNA (cytosine(1402)-N(4))-methyltransferase RsmH n=1 Tax=Algicella marina TaxID=2683284 RepID=UPI0024DF30B5|nr:16S rRNA (cytosine(1402)-N(4))-methyltransferase RsmH [Algicella marina]
MTDTATAPHIPVLLEPILARIAPVEGVWLDGTFGAGGYTRALLDAGAERVIAVDRDPEVFQRAASWAESYGDRLKLVEATFDRLDELADEPLTGVVLDIGVSSMQIDQAERGFSFQKDGPLDMRMSGSGPSAADIVNGAKEEMLADILYQYGEERASRRIARRIVAARDDAPITRTSHLAKIVEGALPPARPGQVHPATRSFQALRIAVNDELGQLVRGLMAAERALAVGGWLAVVTFHSLEDRIVKRFFQQRSGGAPRGNRYAPEPEVSEARFELVSRKAVVAGEEEMTRNPRARSAKLRLARRRAVEAGDVDLSTLGLPPLDLTGERR